MLTPRLSTLPASPVAASPSLPSAAALRALFLTAIVDTVAKTIPLISTRFQRRRTYRWCIEHSKQRRYQKLQFDEPTQLTLREYRIDTSRRPAEWECKTMARFFFHFSSKHKFVRDPKGRELNDIGAAHRHALLLINKAVLLLSHELDWSGWSIEISDATGRTVLSVLFPGLRKHMSTHHKG
jgi:hypothetical protein